MAVSHKEAAIFIYLECKYQRISELNQKTIDVISKDKIYI